MSLLIRLLLIACSVLTGAVFLYSAYTKAIPIQPFEYTLVEYLHLPWLIATIGARVLIGLETGLGALIVLNMYGQQKWVLRTSVGLLLVFSVYLAGLWAVAGNNVNCGCFGDRIWMSPAASLVKNAVLLLLAGLLLRYNRGITNKWVNRGTLLLALVAVALPFIIFAIPDGQPSWLRKDRYKIDLSALYADTTRVPHRIPETDLGRGKHIIAFISPSCPHCRIAARKIRLMMERNPSLPFYFVIAGTSSDLSDFWKQTGAQHVPYMRLAARPFFKYTGGVFPFIAWVNDGWVEANADYNTLTQSGIEQWLAQDGQLRK